jgi:flagellar hook protein FlgE
MRLESAFRASREGITAHGQAISVLGDNIANANTPGYKTQRAEFVDILGEREDDRLAEVRSGIGDGVQVGQIRVNFDSGTATPSGRPLDVAISGRGFFMVGDLERPQLTRLGNFQVSKDGFLTTADGLQVLGYTGTAPEVLGPINMVEFDNKPAATTAVTIWGNLDGAGGTNPPPANPTTFQELAQAAGFVSTQSVYDATGERHDLQLFYFKTGANQWTAQAYINGEDVGQAADQPVLLGETNLAFDATGRIPAENIEQSVINLNPAWANGAAQNAIAVQLGNFTQFAGGARIINVTQNGRGDGDILGYEIADDGKIMASLSTGDVVQLGTLALGLVPNPDGLTRLGGGRFGLTEDAGVLAVDRPGLAGRGATIGGHLEASNVDLPMQFTEMIVLQRGYQANSQVLSTANDMLKNTIAMVR